MGRQGAQSWNVDGVEYEIESTYYLVLPDGPQFTIDFRTSEPVPTSGPEALEMVFPLIRHAYETGLHEKAEVKRVLGSGSDTTSHIGVAIMSTDRSQARGFRVNLAVDEIQKRIEAAVRSGHAAEPKLR